jgi:hypothetical protein
MIDRRKLAAEHGPSVFPEAFTKDGTLKDDWPKGAVAMTQKFDLLEDEPLELAVALRKHAEKQAEGGDEVWAKFAEAMTDLVEELEALNLPKGHKGDAPTD